MGVSLHWALPEGTTVGHIPSTRLSTIIHRRDHIIIDGDQKVFEMDHPGFGK